MNEEIGQAVLLDSAILKRQVDLIEYDSVRIVYLLNQLELRPHIGRLILENLRRHQILDDSSYEHAKNRMEVYGLD